MEHSLGKEILDQVDRLPFEKQRQVLEFARRLAAPEGTPAEVLFAFAGTIDPEDLKLMEQAIEEGCEQIETDDW
jgi:hypothetical protein